jgi:hypothetical protein
MYIDFHVKCPLHFSDFNGTCKFSTGFEEIQISNYIKSVQWNPGSIQAHGRMDGQTDRHTDMTNIIVACHYFEREPTSDFI